MKRGEKIYYGVAVAAENKKKLMFVCEYFLTKIWAITMSFDVF